MKKDDLSQLTTADLIEKLEDERNALARMRFTHAISPIENPMRIRYSKKTIARIMTELRKREIITNQSKSKEEKSISNTSDDTNKESTSVIK
jgi:large subunit ribosomal protein L29